MFAKLANSRKQVGNMGGQGGALSVNHVSLSALKAEIQHDSYEIAESLLKIRAMRGISYINYMVGLLGALKWARSDGRRTWFCGKRFGTNLAQAGAD